MKTGRKKKKAPRKKKAKAQSMHKSEEDSTEIPTLLKSDKF